MKHNDPQFTSKVNDFRAVIKRSLTNRKVEERDGREAIYRIARSTIADHLSQTQPSEQPAAWKARALEEAIRSVEHEFNTLEGHASRHATADPTLRKQEPRNSAPTTAPRLPGTSQLTEPLDKHMSRVSTDAIQSSSPDAGPSDTGSETKNLPGNQLRPSASAPSLEALSPVDRRDTASPPAPIQPTIQTNGPAPADELAPALNAVNENAELPSPRFDPVNRSPKALKRVRLPLAGLSIGICVAYLSFSDDFNRSMYSLREAILPNPTPIIQNDTNQLEPTRFQEQEINSVISRNRPRIYQVGDNKNHSWGSVIQADKQSPNRHRITFSDEDIVLDVEWSEDAPNEGNVPRTLDLAFQKTPEMIFVFGMIEAWSAAEGQFRILQGLPVRVGLNRVVYGISEPIRAYAIAFSEQKEHVIVRIPVRFESGTRIHLDLPLTFPAAS